MANKVGPLIKQARTGAKLTQEQLGKKAGLAASDISKAERGELELSQASLKAIAKATGVTQASLLNAAKESTYTGKKTASSSKKTSSSSGKKTSSGAKKTEEGSKLTAGEKKLVELYRAADKTTKENAVKLLKGEKVEGSGLLDSLLGGAMEMIAGKK